MNTRLLTLLACLGLGVATAGFAAAKSAGSHDVKVQQPDAQSPPIDKSTTDKPRGGKPAVAVVSTAFTDRALPDHQRELLNTAFEAASKLPLNPHVKTRSRLQEDALAASLQLDQPTMVRKLVDRIANWRRGTVYASLAFHGADHGDTSCVQRDLEQANAIANEVTKDQNSQDWPRDRIRVVIAKTHALMGEKQKAAEFAAGAVDFEAGKLVVFEAGRIATDDYEAQCKGLDAVLKGAGFEQWKAALGACAQLFNRFYADKERRAAMDERIRHGCPKLPLQIRLETLLEITGYALDHADRAEALDLLDEAGRLVEAATWLPEDHVPFIGQLAALRARAGDLERARRDVQDAMAMYAAARPKITDVFRAKALRPLGEAWAAIGDRVAALDLYKRVVDESLVNPNSRPRTEDLCATCISLAVHDIEPDAELRSKLLAVSDGLGNPW